MVGKAILDFQYGFMQGRQILNAVIIASEVIDLRLKANSRGVICELDIEKSYDHANLEVFTCSLRKNGLVGSNGASLQCASLF